MSVRTRRDFLLAGLAGVTTLTTLGGCSRCQPEGSGSSKAEAGSASLAKIKVQLNWVPEPEFGGIYAARESGGYSRAGLDVEIAGGGPGSPIVQLVAGGQVDFAVAGSDDVITARARGIDVVAIFGTFQTSPQGIMIRGDRNVATLADLKSGTLALEPGLPFGMYLKKKYGFAGATIVPYDGGIAKFLADPMYAQQCYVTAEPIAVRKKGLTPKVFLSADAGFNPYANVLITRGAMLREKMERVRAFASASAEGWRAYLDDPRAANAVMGRLNPAMDAETFAAAAEAQRPLVETDETKKSGLGSMTEARWSTLAAQMTDLGIITKVPPAKECFAAVLPPR